MCKPFSVTSRPFTRASVGRSYVEIIHRGALDFRPHERGKVRYSEDELSPVELSPAQAWEGP